MVAVPDAAYGGPAGVRRRVRVRWEVCLPASSLPKRTRAAAVGWRMDGSLRNSTASTVIPAVIRGPIAASTLVLAAKRSIVALLCSGSSL